MPTLKELYQKIVSGYYNISEIIEFVELAAKAINPNKNINSDLTVSAIQNGFGDPIINAAIEAVEKNPNLVGFQVTKVYSKPDPNFQNRTLIKIGINDINNN